MHPDKNTKHNTNYFFYLSNFSEKITHLSFEIICVWNENKRKSKLLLW